MRSLGLSQLGLETESLKHKAYVTKYGCDVCKNLESMGGLLKDAKELHRGKCKNSLFLELDQARD